MQTAETQYDIGVIVGRFQVHELHDAHRELIQHVVDRHTKVVVILGLAPLPNSATNPLDFESRKQMILDEFPEVIVLYAKDSHSDEVWSRKLDEIINDVRLPGQSAVIYGGRDSFIAHYTGSLPTLELTQAVFQSGTVVRKTIAKSSARATADFRAGAIWASQGRFPTAYTTVDVAILKTEALGSSGEIDTEHFDLRKERTMILLGRKPHEKVWRLIGGFSDPRSQSFEEDARREVREETGLEVGNLRYVGSTVVEDWRYRSEPDCIKTMLFAAQYTFGRPAPADDIEEVKWFTFDDRYPLDTEINPAHRPLMAMLRDRKEQ